MNTDTINRYVKATKKLFTAILLDYLIGEIRMYKKIVLNHKKEHENFTIKRAKFLTKEKKMTVNHIEYKPESKWNDHDWLQCVNIFDLFYLAHRKNPVLHGLDGLSANINPKVMLAHLKYACRYYLKANQKVSNEDGLEDLHELFNDNKHNVKYLKKFNQLLQ